MRVITEVVVVGVDIEPPAWPVDAHGNSQVPRVGDDVVLPDANLVVVAVYWNPLGDPDGWPEHGLQPGEPFVFVTLGGVSDD